MNNVIKLEIYTYKWNRKYKVLEHCHMEGKGGNVKVILN